MKIKSAFLVFLFSLLSHAAFAGCNSDSLITDVLNVLKLKHNYEASTSKMFKQKKDVWSVPESKLVTDFISGNIVSLRDSLITLEAYKESIVSIKRKKKRYIDEIECLMGNDSNKSFNILYNFMHPLSSIIDKESMMNRLDFLKIFKHFIFDLDNNALPPLKEAAEYLKNI